MCFHGELIHASSNCISFWTCNLIDYSSKFSIGYSKASNHSQDYVQPTGNKGSESKDFVQPTGSKKSKHVDEAVAVTETDPKAEYVDEAIERQTSDQNEIAAESMDHIVDIETADAVKIDEAVTEVYLCNCRLICPKCC